MRLFGEAKLTRGSIAWTNPLRLRITVSPKQAPEYDEDGRVYVFRFARSAPKPCAIDRDRIFDYIKKNKLPDEADRALRRDLRNRVDLYGDLRELQTHPNVLT